MEIPGNKAEFQMAMPSDKAEYQMAMSDFMMTMPGNNVKSVGNRVIFPWQSVDNRIIISA